MSPILLPTYDPPRGEGLFRTTCSPQPLLYGKSQAPSDTSGTNYTGYAGWEAALWSRRAPPSTSQVTSSRSAEAAQPRPLNKGLPGRAAQGVDWGRGPGQSCCRLRGGRPDFLQLRRGREGAALQEGVLVRGGRREHGGALNQARTLSC